MSSSPARDQSSLRTESPTRRWQPRAGIGRHAAIDVYDNRDLDSKPMYLPEEESPVPAGFRQILAERQLDSESRLRWFRFGCISGEDSWS